VYESSTHKLIAIDSFLKYFQGHLFNGVFRLLRRLGSGALHAAQESYFFKVFVRCVSSLSGGSNQLLPTEHSWLETNQFQHSKEEQE